MARTAIHCADCGLYKPHGGRGLCRACYKHHHRVGTLHHFAAYGVPMPIPDAPATAGVPCREHPNPDAWHDFPGGGDGATVVEEIKALCRPCPIREQCLAIADAIEGTTTAYAWGIWGGLTPTERLRRRIKAVA